jgi:hypothetical protein
MAHLLDLIVRIQTQCEYVESYWVTMSDMEYREHQNHSQD